MFNDGPKRTGRYLKKNDKTLKSIVLREFPFQDLAKAKIIEHDNPNSNIIFARYHTDEILRDHVLVHESMSKDLRKPENIRPILRPLDFTRDWERQKARATRGSSQKSEDIEDELELELEFQAKNEAEQRNTTGSPKTPSSEPADDSEAEAETENVETAVAPPIEPDSESANMKSFKNQKTNLDEVGKAINSLAELQIEEQPPSNNFALTPNKSVSQESNAQLAAPTSQDFIPSQPPPNGSGVQDFERAAIEQYKQAAQNTPLNEQDRSSALEKAKAEGYESGFRIGEEKAAIQFQTKTQELIDEIIKLKKELQNVKKDVLNNVEQNFYELCQAMAESLLRREFSIDPQSFGNVLKKALAEVVDEDKISVAVSQDFFDRISALNLKELNQILTVDANLKAGDFRIDSSLSVVDGRVEKIIRDLLSQVDHQLINVNDKAS